MKWKALVILAIIIVSLFPLYLFYKYLQQVMRPKESLRKFLFFLIIIFALVFAYTFLLGFLIRLLFPGA